MRSNTVAGSQNSAQIRVENVIPISFTESHSGRAFRAACGVHENVDFAEGDCELQHFLQRLPVGDIQQIRDDRRPRLSISAVA
jgi:hypothetical protein